MDKRLLAVVVSLVLAMAVIGLFMRAQAADTPAPGENVVMKLNVSSPAFTNGDRMPVKCTCDGEDISPPLSWSAGPAGTKSYALIMDDPDAPGGTFTHWVIYDIPSGTTALDEYVTTAGRLGDGTMQGKNSFGRTGYGGPCPPHGSPHHYRFKVYALDSMLSPGSGASRDSLLKAMSGHVLAEGELTGVYGR